MLYIGVTADLPARVARHRAGEGSAFCRKYNLGRLVLAEHHDTIDDAILREKLLKTWRRSWKIELIENAKSGMAGLMGRSAALRQWNSQLSLE